MASVDRRWYATAMAGRRQGTLLRRVGRQADGGVHHLSGIDIHRRKAGSTISRSTGSGPGNEQARVCGLPRWAVSDQPAGRIIHHDANHADPQLEAKTLTRCRAALTYEVAL